MVLKRAGFFRELSYGGGAESLRDLVGKFAGAEFQTVVKYLRDGHTWVVAPGPAIDVLSSDKKKICPIAILTDGVYAWPQEFAYYVQTYQVAIPTEFLKYMKSQNWIIPPVDIHALDEAVMADAAQNSES